MVAPLALGHGNAYSGSPQMTQYPYRGGYPVPRYNCIALMIDVISIGVISIDSGRLKLIFRVSRDSNHLLMPVRVFPAGRGFCLALGPGFHRRGARVAKGDGL